MGHTNSTANLSLPQFIGTDKPTWLGDINGAFSAIDAYAGTNDAAVSAAASDASSAISQAASAVNTANTANTTAGNASTAANNAVGVANNAVAIAGVVDGKVGLLADLTTTDRTSIVNAINEVNAGLGGATAATTSYDNSGSGLTATNVQDAIDELAGGGAGSVSITNTNTDTNADLFDAFYAMIDFTKVGQNSVIVREEGATKKQYFRIANINTGTGIYDFVQTGMQLNDFAVYTISLQSSGSKYLRYTTTYNDFSSSTDTSKLTLFY